MSKVKYAKRIKDLPPYLFAEIDKVKEDVRKKGVDIIDLGIGDPDIPTPQPIIEALISASKDPRNHRYPTYEGMIQFREKVAEWYGNRFKVALDPQKEVLTLIGSKEGIGHLPLAFIDPGDIVLCPSPGYPVYKVGTQFAGGEPYFLPLKKERHFLPDLSIIPLEIAQRAKVIYINYPNNPTAATAEKGFFEEIVKFAKKFDLIVCHDAAYSEIFYDNYRPASFLEVEDAKEVGIEFHSLSKTYNMTGWRIGFAVGNQEVIQGLGKIKTNLDSGAFQAIQMAGIKALSLDDGILQGIREIYRERRDYLFSALREIGLEAAKPLATFYLWASVPLDYTSATFASFLLKEAGIVATPGSGFGEAGEGFIRFALTVDKKRIVEATERLGKLRF
ncbi:MAG: LL-diaminopimelate aminotransferase [bacterium]|nr:LL-diaminopimelate aminotransferase [bacterium]